MTITEKRLDCVDKIRQMTFKEKVFVLVSDEENTPAGYNLDGVSFLKFGKFDQLTLALANGFGNVAGIVVLPHLYPDTINHTLLRRIRQLASADGALIVWDDFEGSDAFLKEREKMGADVHCWANSGELNIQVEGAWS